jgi:hypothetical protein
MTDTERDPARANYRGFEEPTRTSRLRNDGELDWIPHFRGRDQRRLLYRSDFARRGRSPKHPDAGGRHAWRCCRRQATTNGPLRVYQPRPVSLEEMGVARPWPQPLEKEPIVNSGKLHRCGARFVIVRHLIDPSACGIASHAPGVVGLQQLGGHT